MNNYNCNIIRSLRKDCGLSQTEFGKRLGGVPLRTIQNWEGGINTCPSYVVELIKYRVENDQRLRGMKSDEEAEV